MTGLPGVCQLCRARLWLGKDRRWHEADGTIHIANRCFRVRHETAA